MPKTNPMSMIMFMPTHRCKLCGHLLEYFGEWKDENEDAFCPQNYEQRFDAPVKHERGARLTAAEKRTYFAKVGK